MFLRFLKDRLIIDKESIKKSLFRPGQSLQCTRIGLMKICWSCLVFDIPFKKLKLYSPSVILNNNEIPSNK